MIMRVQKTTMVLMNGFLLRDSMERTSIKRRGVNRYVSVYMDEAKNFRNHIKEACGRVTLFMHQIANCIGCCL